MRDIPVPAEVIIESVLTERTFRGHLSNGRSIFIFVPRMAPLPQIEAGDRILANLSLSDFSRGEFSQLLERGQAVGSTAE